MKSTENKSIALNKIQITAKLLLNGRNSPEDKVSQQMGKIASAKEKDTTTTLPCLERGSSKFHLQGKLAEARVRKEIFGFRVSHLMQQKGHKIALSDLFYSAGFMPLKFMVSLIK